MNVQTCSSRWRLGRLLDLIRRRQLLQQSLELLAIADSCRILIAQSAIKERFPLFRYLLFCLRAHQVGRRRFACQKSQRETPDLINVDAARVCGNTRVCKGLTCSVDQRGKLDLSWAAKIWRCPAEIIFQVDQHRLVRGRSKSNVHLLIHAYRIRIERTMDQAGLVEVSQETDELVKDREDQGFLKRAIFEQLRELLSDFCILDHDVTLF